jgi:hypothetical protein
MWKEKNGSRLGLYRLHYLVNSTVLVLQYGYGNLRTM